MFFNIPFYPKKLTKLVFTGLGMQAIRSYATPWIKEYSCLAYTKSYEMIFNGIPTVLNLALYQNYHKHLNNIDTFSTEYGAAFLAVCFGASCLGSNYFYNTIFYLTLATTFYGASTFALDEATQRVISFNAGLNARNIAPTTFYATLLGITAALPAIYYTPKVIKKIKQLFSKHKMTEAQRLEILAQKQQPLSEKDIKNIKQSLTELKETLEQNNMDITALVSPKNQDFMKKWIIESQKKIAAAHPVGNDSAEAPMAAKDSAKAPPPSKCKIPFLTH